MNIKHLTIILLLTAHTHSCTSNLLENIEKNEHKAPIIGKEDVINDINNKNPKLYGILQKKGIKEQETDTIKTLNLEASGLNSLQGLESFLRLEELNLDNNNITDLRPLSKLKYLQILSFKNNKITDLSPLYHKLTIRKRYNDLTIGFPQGWFVPCEATENDLEYINFEDNPILDFSDFINEKFDYRKLEGNQDDFVALRGIKLKNKELWKSLRIKGKDSLSKEIIINGNIANIQSISGIENFENLKSLSIINLKPGIDFSPIEKLNDLEAMNISSSNLHNLDVLNKVQSLSKIKVLKLKKNKIQNITSIIKLYNLESLNLDDNEIIDLSILSKLEKLRDLSVKNNKGLDYEILVKLIQQSPKLEIHKKDLYMNYLSRRTLGKKIKEKIPKTSWKKKHKHISSILKPRT